MATLVCFHAHPDDEAILTGGVMAKAADDGHRVVLVTATGGEHAGFGWELLGEGQTMGELRAIETRQAADVLGISRVEFLGYVDSGMAGAPTNDEPASFWGADVEEAAGRLAAVLRQEAADVVTVYDRNGLYGHPDHVQVHRVGHRAAELAGTPRVYEATMNRDHLGALLALARQMEILLPDGNVEVADEDVPGLLEDELTTRVDVSAYVERKRDAMRAHRSQISEDNFFLKLPMPAFAMTFGVEWFVRTDTPTPQWETDLFEGLA